MSDQSGIVEVSNFGYSGERGPVNWASLAPENEACRTSKIQSPIVLDNTIEKAKERPVVKIANVEEAEFEVSRFATHRGAGGRGREHSTPRPLLFPLPSWRVREVHIS